MAAFALGVVVGFLVGGIVLWIICRAGMTQAEFERDAMQRLWKDAISRNKGWWT